MSDSRPSNTSVSSVLTKIRRPVSETARLTDVYIQEWLRNNNRDSAQPKDVMQYLVENRVFDYDRKQGLPLREMLRRIEKLGKLHLVLGVRHMPNRRWIFNRVELNTVKGYPSNNFS